MKARLNPLRARGQHGMVVVEMVFIIMLLCIMLLCAFVLGRLVWRYNIVTGVAGSGARYLSAGPWSDTRVAEAKTLMDQLADESGVSGLTYVTFCSPDNDCGAPGHDTLILTVKAPFEDPTQFIFGDPQVLKVTSTVYNSQ